MEYDYDYLTENTDVPNFSTQKDSNVQPMTDRNKIDVHYPSAQRDSCEQPVTDRNKIDVQDPSDERDSYEQPVTDRNKIDAQNPSSQRDSYVQPVTDKVKDSGNPYLSILEDDVAVPNESSPVYNSLVVENNDHGTVEGISSPLYSGLEGE